MGDNGSPEIVLTMHLGTACSIASLAERVKANAAAGVLAHSDADSLTTLAGLIRQRQDEYLRRLEEDYG